MSCPDCEGVGGHDCERTPPPPPPSAPDESQRGGVVSARDDYPDLADEGTSAINAALDEIDRLRVAVDAARRWIDATPATDEWVDASDAFVSAVVQMDDPYRRGFTTIAAHIPMSQQFLDSLPKIRESTPDEVNEDGELSEAEWLARYDKATPIDVRTPSEAET